MRLLSLNAGDQVLMMGMRLLGVFSVPLSVGGDEKLLPRATGGGGVNLYEWNHVMKPGGFGLN